MENRYLKNLIAIACADGVIDNKEMDLLESAALEAGIPSKELQNLLKDCSAYVPEIPDNREEREHHLIKMINMATADGDFSQKEFELCNMIAEKLEYQGFSHALRKSMNKHYLKNLVALACADGNIDDSEMKILKEAARDAGLNEADLEHLIETRDDYRHFIPESEEERETQLAQMISLAIADGEFTVEEYQLCKVVAERLGFSEEELKMIIKLSFKGTVSLE